MEARAFLFNDGEGHTNKDQKLLFMLKLQNVMYGIFSPALVRESLTRLCLQISILTNIPLELNFFQF